MGISGLTSLLKQCSPSSIAIKSLAQYKNKKIAIDTSLFMHKFMYSYGNLINGFFHQIYHLRSYHIQPVYVFDGKPPQEKQNVLAKRKQAKVKLETRIQGLENELKKIEQIHIPKAHSSTYTEEERNIVEQKKQIKKKLRQSRRQVFKMTSKDFQNIRTLFDLLQVPYYDAIGEADVLCVQLNKQNIVDACMTEDMDFLTHGCPHLLRDFKLSNKYVTEYNLDSILKDMEITREQFIDICILCGCDYTCKIKRLGPKSALKLIKEHGSIENIIENCCGENKKYCYPKYFDYKKARLLFDASNVPDMQYTMHHTKETNIMELRYFLMQHIKITKAQMNRKIRDMNHFLNPLNPLHKSNHFE